jgi:hypothetical protein
MVEAKTQLLWLEKTKKQQDSVEIEAYLKPSWVLASTNTIFFGLEVKQN